MSDPFSIYRDRLGNLPGFDGGKLNVLGTVTDLRGNVIGQLNNPFGTITDSRGTVLAQFNEQLGSFTDLRRPGI